MQLVENAIDDITNKQIQKQMDALQRKRSNLKEDTRFSTNLNIDNILGLKESLQKHLMGLTSSIELTNNLLVNGNLTDVLAVSRDLRSSLNEQVCKPGMLEEYVQPVFIRELHVTKKLMPNAVFDKFASESDPGSKTCEVLCLKNIAMNLLKSTSKTDNQGRLLNISKHRMTCRKWQVTFVFRRITSRKTSRGWALDFTASENTPDSKRCVHQLKPHFKYNWQYNVNSKVDGKNIKAGIL